MGRLSQRSTCSPVLCIVVGQAATAAAAAMSLPASTAVAAAKLQALPEATILLRAQGLGLHPRQLRCRIQLFQPNFHMTSGMSQLQSVPAAAAAAAKIQELPKCPSVAKAA